jgi:hypothetical protein
VRRILHSPLAARYVLMLRARVLARAVTLQRTSSTPQVMNYDMSLYSESAGAFTYRSPCGSILQQHPAVRNRAAYIPAFSHGLVVAPSLPPSQSSAVLRPEASGAWCYHDEDSGYSSWEPPGPGSTTLASRCRRSLSLLSPSTSLRRRVSLSAWGSMLCVGQIGFLCLRMLLMR